ncbi:MAG: phosphopantothenoylcysteine decarboxylase [Candidatus Omnitrophota bacterium]
MFEVKVRSKTKKKNKSPFKVLVTAGPTIEPLDPVRYISNYSTGEIGYAIAKEARDMGFSVCLVSGPVRITEPKGVRVVRVTTALEMAREVQSRVGKCDCIIMAAAVCDFRPSEIKKQKIKKNTLPGEVCEGTITLVRNPDILEQIEKRDGLIKIGFALETENVLRNAKIKMERKGLNLIVVNSKTSSKNPFGPGKKDFYIIDNKNKVQKIEAIEKKQMAKKIVMEAKELMR